MYWQRLLCLGTVLVVSGCAADYLNRYDSLTLAAGDAGRANLLLQTVDPFNPDSQNTHIEGDGQRTAGVVQAFRGIPLAPPSQVARQDGSGNSGNHPCDLRTQVDSLGRPCGERAAEAKPGGRTGHEAD